MKILFMGFILSSFSLKIFANEGKSSTRNKNYEIQAIIYSSLGTGLNLSYKLKRNIWLNFVTQSLIGEMSKNYNNGLAREDADYEFQTKYINVRHYLANIINDLFIQYGIAYLNWDTKSIIKSNENSKSKAVYKTNYPTYAINTGVGVNWVFDRGLSLGLCLVRIINEEPSFTYELKEDWECDRSCQSNYESNVKKYTPNNSLYFNFGYNF